MSRRREAQIILEGGAERENLGSLMEASSPFPLLPQPQSGTWEKKRPLGAGSSNRLERGETGEEGEKGGWEHGEDSSFSWHLCAGDDGSGLGRGWPGQASQALVSGRSSTGFATLL